MKLYLFTLLATLIAGSAQAEEIRHLKVHKDTALISEYDTHIQLADAQYVMVPKTIRIVPTRCTSDSESDCTRAEVLQRVPVVQVTVRYRDGVVRDEGSYKTVDLELNLPVTAFSQDQLATLKENSRTSFTGHTQRARQEFIKNNLRLEITRVEKPTRVLDEERSKLCETEHLRESPAPDCKEERKYKTQVIKYKKVKVVVNHLTVD